MANQFKDYTPVVGRKESKRWAAPAATSYDGSGWGDDFDEEEEDMESSVASASHRGPADEEESLPEDSSDSDGMTEQMHTEEPVESRESPEAPEVDPRRNTTDFIYGYYETGGLYPGVMDHDTNHPYASLISDSQGDFSDSTASLSTGRRSVSSNMDPPLSRFEGETNPRSSTEYQSELDQVPEHPESENDSGSLDTEKLEQDRLESEIMQSFTPVHSAKSSVDSNQIDPEVVALYQNSSEILDRPISVYQTVEPLHMRQEMSDKSIRSILTPKDRQTGSDELSAEPEAKTDGDVHSDGAGSQEDGLLTPRKSTMNEDDSEAARAINISNPGPEIERMDTVTGPIAPRYHPDPVEAPLPSEGYPDAPAFRDSENEDDVGSESDVDDDVNDSTLSRELAEPGTSASGEIDEGSSTSLPAEHDSEVDGFIPESDIQPPESEITGHSSSPDTSHDHKISDSSGMSVTQSDVSKGSSGTAGGVEHDRTSSSEGVRTQMPSSAGSQQIQQKVRRPPQVDFTALLSSGGSESRYQQLRALRIREAEYSSGLDLWVQNTYASIEPGMTLYANGKPPPSQEAKQNVGRQVSTAVSSAIGHTRTKETLGRVGEKSRGFFAKGRKLLRSGDG